MQISASTPLPPTTTSDRQAGQTQPPGQATAQAQAAKQAQTPEKSVQSTPKVWTPAPPLRPNIQDYVDINRTLIALRSL